MRMAMSDMKQDFNAMTDRPDLLLNGTAVPVFKQNFYKFFQEGVKEPLLLDIPQTEVLVNNNGLTRKRRPSTEELQAKLIKTMQVKVLCSLRVQVLIKRQQKEDAGEKLANEWRQVAKVLDSLLFWLFLMATSFITFTLLVLIPFLYRPFDDDDDFYL